MRPVRISGPFYFVRVSGNRRQARTWQGAYRVERNGDRAEARVRCEGTSIYAYIRGARLLTLDRSARVVDDALVVLVLTVRKVHAHCEADASAVPHALGETHCSPMLTPARMSSASFSGELTLGPAENTFRGTLEPVVSWLRTNGRDN